MNKYKIKNHIVNANSPTEALKIHKLLDSLKDENTFMIIDKDEGAYIYNIKSNNNSILSYDTTYNPKIANKFSKQEAENIIKKLENNPDWKNQFKISEFLGDSKVKDTIDFDYLLSEERKAVEDYRQAINQTTDKNELYVLSHILKEETHHIEMLENLRNGKVKFSDYNKSKYYFIPDDSYGQHGTDIFEIYLTKEEADKIKETRIYNNQRGFLTNSYRSALYYTQD